MDKLAKYLITLTITQGQGAGERLKRLPWQRKFVRGAFASDHDAALSVGRGNGKTTLVAGIGCAALDGPLVAPRAECILVASSFNQARLAFAHMLGFLGERYDLSDRKGRWRVQDSNNLATITCRVTGARVRCIGSDPRRAHGLAPSLILADEPAQWPPATSQRMVAALRTSQGKIPNSKFVAFGTRPDANDHWFAKMLEGKSAYGQTHAASKEDPPFAEKTWRKANPSLSLMPDLLKVIRREAKEARRDPEMLAAFNALRLNLGTSDVGRSHLLRPETWAEAEGERERKGSVIFGVDLGTTGAMSAVAAVWSSGRMECIAAFPSHPTLEERERLDGVPGLYLACERSGDLLTAPGRVTPPQWLMREAVRRFGMPDVVLTDRWRLGELQDAVGVLAPSAPLVPRGQGFRDGAEDVRRFRTAILEGVIAPVKSVLLRSAMAEAVTVADPAGNEKLAKAAQGGRRYRAKDDAAAAAILAAAEFMRWQGHDSAEVIPFVRIG